MRPVEEFLKEYFQARTQHYRKSSASWANSMTQYFAPGCKPFAPEAAVEQSEAEEIVAVRSSEAEAEVHIRTAGGERLHLAWPLSTHGYRRIMANR